MKKILVALMLANIAAYIAACDSNPLYFHTDDSPLSLLYPGIDNPGTPPAAIYMYRTTAQHDGALGGRTGADTLCVNELAITSLPITPTTVHAFLSVSASDEIRDLLPSAYWSLPIPIMDGTGTNTIANSWDDLWDGSINMPLHSNAGGAGVLLYGYPWWSGSNADGTYNTDNDNCTNWTVASSGFFSKQGSPNANDATWINLSNQGCSASCYVLCVAY
jgi:hypothetical protein